MADSIALSKYTTALLEQFKKIKAPTAPDDLSKISVSQTVTFFALAYERIRNAVEYRDAHLIRRAAIERILRRRMSMNPTGTNEGENIIRELLWARYFPNESLGVVHSQQIQAIIDVYKKILDQLLVGQQTANRIYIRQFLVHMMSSEIEETLQPQEAKQHALFTFFMFQVLKKKIKIEKVTEEEKNASFFVAIEKGFNQSDTAYLRYHLFTLSEKPLSQQTAQQIEKLIPKLTNLFHKIDSIINNPNTDRLRRFVNFHKPPFLILAELVKRRGLEASEILRNSELLYSDVEQICREKYGATHTRLQTLALKAIVYIFITKMILAIILEYPISMLIYGEVNYASLTINTLIPPFLMFLIATFTKIPDAKNTKRIYQRIVEILDSNNEFETTISLVTKENKVQNPSRIFAFTIFYSITFFITFGLINVLLSLFGFNVISKLLFMFFVSVVTFFAYRIRQTAKLYQLPEGEAVFRPFTDFFLMPILSVGKFLSRSLSHLNFITFIFDFIIEAPFKMIIEVVEEWISFVRQKRDEIV